MDEVPTGPLVRKDLEGIASRRREVFKEEVILLRVNEATEAIREGNTKPNERINIQHQHNPKHNFHVLKKIRYEISKI